MVSRLVVALGWTVPDQNMAVVAVFEQVGAQWPGERWIVDLERSRTFAEVPHYDSTYFITFVWQPPSAKPPDAWQRLSSFPPDGAPP